ncbi:hypothetical protein [Amaricoccus sp.]|uniref:DUF7220 family protein n=1 Tax=Amaricoccus sp. TaxID=1872485 RepID=UPI001B753B0A|nr:hypothetical protein [Amaricoccus sp.]MBP7002298.1 hypothetical protein [Amaricoccus sp.]
MGTVANVAVGPGLAVAAQLLVFPLFDLPTTLEQNLAIRSRPPCPAEALGESLTAIPGTTLSGLGQRSRVCSVRSGAL